jgi:hypothetical protein
VIFCILVFPYKTFTHFYSVSRVPRAPLTHLPSFNTLIIFREYKWPANITHALTNLSIPTAREINWRHVMNLHPMSIIQQSSITLLHPNTLSHWRLPSSGMTSCSPGQIYPLFGNTYSLHSRVYCKDVSRTFLQNVDIFLPEHTMSLLHIRKSYMSITNRSASW